MNIDVRCVPALSTDNEAHVPDVPGEGHAARGARGGGARAGPGPGPGPALGPALGPAQRQAQALVTCVAPASTTAVTDRSCR